MTEPEKVEYKGKIIGKVGGCILISVPGPDGQEHIEATCASKEARDHLAAILEQEAILRVNPKVILEEEIPGLVKPPAEPPVEPPVEPPAEPPAEPPVESRASRA